MDYSVEWVVILLFACLTALLWFRLWRVRGVEKLKYEFMTIVAHKLRTPLTSIKWELSQLLSRSDLDQPLSEGLRRIDSSSNQLLELSNVLVDSAHTQRGSYAYQKEPLDLARFAVQSLARLDTRVQGKNLSVVTEVAPNLPAILGDRGRVASVVDVLIENAVQYNRDGGSIRVTIRAEKKAVRFSVSDTGIGIPQRDMRYLFTPLFRSESAKRVDTEGVGIGLSVAKSIVERHGGKVGAESVGEGRGATFWFTLPVSVSAQ